MKGRGVRLKDCSIEEFLLNKKELLVPQQVVAQSKPKLAQKVLTNADYAQLYYNEELLEVNGEPYPVVVLGAFESLESHFAELLPEPYKVPKRFKKFAAGVLKHRIGESNYQRYVSGEFEEPGEGGPYNGKVFSIADLDVNESGVYVAGRMNGYFDFMAIDQAKDVFLAQFDDLFEKEETLRDYEIRAGKAVALEESVQTNMMGSGFILFNSKEGYFIFGERKKNLAVDAGALGIFGGTPKWYSKAWNPPRPINFASYLRSETEKEMQEEVCLNPEEIKINKVVWVKDFWRAPEPFFFIDTNIPIEEIADRCSQSDEAKKEHEVIYKVPMDCGVIDVLMNDQGGNYKISDPTKLSIELFRRYA